MNQFLSGARLPKLVLETCRCLLRARGDVFGSSVLLSRLQRQASCVNVRAARFSPAFYAAVGRATQSADGKKTGRNTPATTTTTTTTNTTSVSSTPGMRPGSRDPVSPADTLSQTTCDVYSTVPGGAQTGARRSPQDEESAPAREYRVRGSRVRRKYAHLRANLLMIQSDLCEAFVGS